MYNSLDMKENTNNVVNMLSIVVITVTHDQADTYHGDQVTSVSDQVLLHTRHQGPHLTPTQPWFMTWPLVFYYALQFVILDLLLSWLQTNSSWNENSDMWSQESGT